MSNIEHDAAQPLGLDIGTSRIVVARKTDKKYQYESMLNAFITLPHSKLTESLMVQENVFHEVLGSEIVVAGNDALRTVKAFRAQDSTPHVVYEDGATRPPSNSRSR